MSNQYTLTCPHCQHAIEVTTRQAGQEISCPACEEKTQAPRLGEMKKLPQAGNAIPKNRSGEKKSGGLFVAGLLLLLIGAASGGGLYYYASQKLTPYEKQIEEFLSEMEADVDSASPGELTTIMINLPTDKGLGPWQEQPYVANNKQGVILTNISYGLMGLGGLGLGLMLFGLTRK